MDQKRASLTGVLKDPRERWILGGLVAIAAVARFATIDLQSYYHDEAVTALKVLQPSLFDTIDEVVDGERSPPLYYIFAWLWSQPFGVGEIGLRSLSALFGLAVVPVAYLIGRELASRNAAIISAALVAVSPYLIWYSQDARSYELSVLFGALSLLWFMRALREPTSRTLAWWAIVAALALSTHYFTLFLVVPEVLWLLLKSSRGRPVVAAVASVAVVGAALAPLALYQQDQIIRNEYRDQPLVERVAEMGLDFVASDEPDPLSGTRTVDLVQIGAAAGAAVLGLLALGLGCRNLEGSEREGASAIGFVALFALLVPLLLAFVGQDFIRSRNMIGLLLPLLLLAALAFGAARSGRLGAVAALATVAMFATVVVGVAAFDQMHREDWRGAAEVIGPSDETRLIIASKNGDDPLSYYLGAEKFKHKTFDAGVKVSELVVLTTGHEVHRVKGFHEVSKEPVGVLFTLWRFESEKPVLVRPDDVSGNKVIAERAEALLDLP